MENVQLLQTAIDNQQDLTVIYLDESTQGQVTDITPLRITGNNVQARCIASNSIKPFQINKLSIVTNYDQLTQFVSRTSTTKHISTMDELVAAIKPHFNPADWFIYVSNDRLSIEVFSKTDGGQIETEPALSLSFMASQQDEFDELTLPSNREPWVVCIQGKPPLSFCAITSAVAQFIKWSDELLLLTS